MSTSRNSTPLYEAFNGIAMSSFFGIKLDITTLIFLNAPQSSAGMVSEPAGRCGA
jgi:hypothetical protein